MTHSAKVCQTSPLHIRKEDTSLANDNKKKGSGATMGSISDEKDAYI